MYNNLGAQPGGPTQPNPFGNHRPPYAQPNPFEDAFYGASSGFLRGGLGAYGEKILGSSSEYVQSNISRYFFDPRYYFQVNDHYVRNKLKLVLFPFLHKGNWTRTTEPVGGIHPYKPPIYDIHAPDLYIPFMAFATYVVLAGLSLGLHGKFAPLSHNILVSGLEIYFLFQSLPPYSVPSVYPYALFYSRNYYAALDLNLKAERFSPEALHWLFIKGIAGWFFQVALLRITLFSLGSGEAPLLDIVAYAGYTFTGLSLAVLGKLFWENAYFCYYLLLAWTCCCTAAFLLRTMKRVLYDSSRQHYLLILVAAQFPLMFWLGNITLNWLL